jgi:multiple sugar transport system permease protein
LNQFALPRLSKKTRRDLFWALLFIAPWIIGFLAFNLYPTLASFYYSFTDKALIKAPNFIGLDNYIQLFTKDKAFGKSVYNTFYMVVLGVPLNIIIAFLTAQLLNLDIKGMAIYRTVYYLPTVMPVIAGVLLWKWILNPQYGMLTMALEPLGIRSPAWFADPTWSKPALLMMGVWGIGGSTVLYLAALKGVPKEYYESATLDGASWLEKTIKITIPLVSPVTLFLLITGLISAFQIFTQAFMIGGMNDSASGAPRESLLFYALYLYRQGFIFLKMGMASAMAWILFLIILIATVIMLKTSNLWTHYEM